MIISLEAYDLNRPFSQKYNSLFFVLFGVCWFVVLSDGLNRFYAL